MKQNEAQVLLEKLNPQLKKMGLAELALVSPKECFGQAKNARYMDAEIFDQLTQNIKNDGRLESVPLCYRDEKSKIRIISGHHRVDAAKEAGLAQILIMLIDPKNRDEIVSKQLGHNAISGKDDEAVLNELFQSISDIQLKLATGLNDAISKVNYESLNFKVGTFKEVVFMFLPTDLSELDEALEKLAQETTVKGSQVVRLAFMPDYEPFMKVLRKVKKVENIKANGVAISRMAVLALEKIKENQQENQKKNAGK